MSYSSRGALGVLSREVDIRTTGAVADDASDSTAAIQRAYDLVLSMGGGSVVVPLGGVFKVMGTVRVSAGPVTFRGGGSLHFDSSARSAVSIPGVGDVLAGIVVWSGASRRRYVSPSVPYDPAFLSELVADVTIGDVRFFDDFGYSTPYAAGSTAIFLAGVNRFAMTGAEFSGFRSEIVNGDVQCLDSKIQGVSFHDSCHNGISGVVTEGCEFSGNTFSRVGQPFELGLYRGKISGNTIDYCNQNGIWVSTTSQSCTLSGEVTGNTVTHAEVNGAGILIENVTDVSCLGDLLVDGNHVSGAPRSGGNLILAQAYRGSLTSDGGRLTVSNNVTSEDAGTSVDWASSIQIFSAAPSPPTVNVEVSGNDMTHRTGHAYGSLNLSGGHQHVLVRMPNVTHLAVALRGGG